MSSSRRTPRAAQPSRRPRVAGLRKPEGTPPSSPGETEPTSGHTGTLPVEPDAETTTLDAVTDESGEQERSATPAPRRKARDRGERKPVSEDEVSVADERAGDDEALVRRVEPEQTKRGRTDGRRGYALVAVLLVLAVVFAGLAVLFKLKSSEVTAATDNAALVDVAKTAEVKQAMSSAAEQLFSIDFNNIDKTQQAADKLLVNKDVRDKYNLLMQDVRKRAPQQKIVVTVKATRSAVVRLEDDRAKVMVYIDQTATRATDKQTSSGSAALWFNTEKQGGTWKVTGMDTYSSGTPTPSPAAKPGS